MTANRITNITTRQGDKMRVWVLQIRECSDDPVATDQVYLFTSQEKAEQSAYRQLYDYAESNIEHDEEELYNFQRRDLSLKELGEMVENNEWGCYNIFISEVE